MITELILVGTATALRALKPWRRRSDPGNLSSLSTDPFEALRVQMRLQALADEIRRLHRDESVFARAARLEASTRAYDDLLGRACHLAGVSETAEITAVPGFATPTPVRLAGRDLRARRELLLAERGWSWCSV
ncbi:hypothetical protein [Kineosporia sp. NBRC 101731]|uniref:hypothetical protein n=1 Tax=Kineosporia sp. NBRC 101731 TaxID=3032199 RepID=UPI0024A1F71E|nr:hypothetical protein [Kineosporia sp. NBRC 101731]GLY31403.1 hypothetical protein Kisp02_47680 [Kineosporia sp. NBRC 101731]